MILGAVHIPGEQYEGSVREPERPPVDGPRGKQIGIHAVRGGDIAGDHTVLFATEGEQLSVVHRAHSPESFAKGAIRAARWVVNAPKGLHDISEVLFQAS